MNIIDGNIHLLPGPAISGHPDIVQNSDMVPYNIFIWSKKDMAVHRCQMVLILRHDHCTKIHTVRRKPFVIINTIRTIDDFSQFILRCDAFKYCRLQILLRLIAWRNPIMIQIRICPVTFCRFDLSSGGPSECQATSSGVMMSEKNRQEDQNIPHKPVDGFPQILW